MPVSLPTAMLLVAGAGAGATVYAVDKQRKAQHEAQDSASKMQEDQQAFLEKQAGEYYTLTQKEMEYQSAENQINTLGSLIMKRQQPVESLVFTLPPAKEYKTVDRINQAIHDLIARN